MKKLLCLAVMFITLIATGQDCTSYYFMQNSKTAEMALYDKKGEPIGKLVYTISGLVANDTGSRTNVTVEQFNKKGKNIFTYHNVMQCKGGTFIMDFKFLTSEAQEKQYEWARRKGWTSYDYLEYPPQLSVGEHLKDGKFHNDRNNGQGVQLVDMNLTDRKVEGKASITTPAGTWDCFKISYKYKTAIQFYGNVNVVNMECMEWYAPGFGVVKTQYKDYGSAELISVR